MFMEPNKNIIFEEDTNVTITYDNEFLIKGYYSHIKNLIIECIKNTGKSKNIKVLQKNISKFPKVVFFLQTNS